MRVDESDTIKHFDFYNCPLIQLTDLKICINNPIILITDHSNNLLTVHFLLTI